MLATSLLSQGHQASGPLFYILSDKPNAVQVLRAQPLTSVHTELASFLTDLFFLIFCIVLRSVPLLTVSFVYGWGVVTFCARPSFAWV